METRNKSGAISSMRATGHLLTHRLSVRSKWKCRDRTSRYKRTEALRRPGCCALNVAFVYGGSSPTRFVTAIRHLGGGALQENRWGCQLGFRLPWLTDGRRIGPH